MQSTLRLSRCSRLLLVREGVKKHARGLQLSVARCSKFEDAFPPREEFQTRHIGPREHEQAEMLKTLGIKVNAVLSCHLFLLVNFPKLFKYGLYLL